MLLLVESFLEHHPDVPVTVLFVDASPDDRYPDFPCEVIGPDALPMDRDAFLLMATYYDVMELSTAVKPFLLRYLLDRGTDVVMYLDPDIEVFAPLDDLFDLASERQIVLTPHLMHPMPRDGLNISEDTIMASGQFNLGFIAVSGQASPFLEFWWERTRVHGRSEQSEGYFVDQRWVDAVPVFFEHAVCRDTACNLAYWNLHERKLEDDPSGGWTVDGAPLRFFHYSGHDPSTPTRLSRHVEPPERIRVDQQPALGRLLRERSARMHALEAPGGPPPYGWKRSAGRLELTKNIRRACWRAVCNAEEHGTAPPPHAFGADGGRAFTEWLLEPAEPGAPLTRFQHAVARDFPHYQRLFPEPLGDDAPRFLEAAWIDRTLLRLAPIELRPPPRAVPGGLPGVNLVGYLDGEFGVAAAGRMVARMVRASGMPMATTVLRPPEHEHRECFPTTITGAPFRLSVLAMNADGLVGFADTPEFDRHRDHPRVGVWYWEIGALPEWMRPAYDLVDEIWCASDHVRSALAGVSERPIRKHPLAITVPSALPKLTRLELGLPLDAFLFGFVFDYRSVLARKNPLGLIDAYRRAFSPDDGAALILKAINSTSAPEHAAAVSEAVGDRPDIHVVDRHLDRVEMRALFHLLHCYVSLHRSEGLGLTIATAMAAGTPAIATGWSGNMEFMTPEDAMLVPYSLVEVGPDAAPYSADAWWADPDLDAAADAMRRLFDDPELARTIGCRGRSRVADVGDVDTSARWFADRYASLTGLEVAVR